MKTGARVAYVHTKRIGCEQSVQNKNPGIRAGANASQRCDRLRGADRTNLCGLPGHDALNVVGPHRQRARHLRQIRRVIVATRDAILMTADVVQNGLDVVGLNAEFVHPGRDGVPQIMQPPIGHRPGRGEQRLFAVSPNLEAIAARTEQMIDSFAPWDCADDIERHAGKRECVGAMIL